MLLLGATVEQHGGVSRLYADCIWTTHGQSAMKHRAYNVVNPSVRPLLRVHHRPSYTEGARLTRGLDGLHIQ